MNEYTYVSQLTISIITHMSSPVNQIQEHTVCPICNVNCELHICDNCRDIGCHNCQPLAQCYNCNMSVCQECQQSCPDNMLCSASNYIHHHDFGAI